MARAASRFWLIGLGMVVATMLFGSLCLQVQAQSRLSRAHLALSNAIDSERRGDYEMAATFFRQAQEGQDDLTPAERQDLTNGLLRVNVALRHRREGTDKLQQLEDAVRNQRIPEANQLLREVMANQYLAPADKQKAQQFAAQLRPTPSSQPLPATTPSLALIQARVKLQQARALMAKGNYAAAETLAQEADKLNAAFSPTEDTPRQLLADIAQAKGNPNPPISGGTVASQPVGHPAVPTGNAAPTSPTPTASHALPGVAPLVRARIKLQQGRAMLTKGQFDDAERLAVEASRLQAAIPEGEDTPTRLLDDVVKARLAAKPDARGLLSAARAAYERNDLDHAEQLAQAAEKASNIIQRHTMFGDSPAKVLRDVQAARTSQPKSNPAVAQATKPPQPSANTVAQGSKPPQPSASDNKPAPQANDSKSPTIAAAPLKPATDTQAEKTEQARALIAQGRRALQSKDLKKANELAQQAQDLKPDLNWWEDTPTKLLADIGRVTAKPNQATTVSADAKPAQGVTTSAQPKAEKRDPRGQLQEARALYEKGELDEAKDMALKIQLTANTRWGLFEDSPDKLINDINKANARRNKEESVKLLAEARKKLAENKIDEAEQLAHRAERLHGPYSIWELGDRPSKVIAEAQTMRARQRKPELPPLPTVDLAKNDKQPQTSDKPTPQIASGPQSPVPNTVTAKETSSQQPVVAQGTPPLPVWPDEKPSSPPNDMGHEIQQTRLAATSTDTISAPRVGNQVTTPPTPPELPSPVLAEARRTLAEARDLQKQGLLIEARQKALEAQQQAQRGGVTFGPHEDLPERALLEMGALCKDKIDGLVQKATDYAATAQEDPSRLRQAEADLLQARQLASGFSMDTHMIDSKMQWLRQLQAHTGAAGAVMTPPVPGAPVTPPSVAGTAVAEHKPETPEQRGLELLEKARLELRRGETATARRLAEEAFEGPYGVQQAAAEVLRSVDIEEFNGTVARADRLFEAGMSAFRRKEYHQARSIFDSFDTRLLKAEKQSKIKEVMLMPEMQPSALAQVSAVESADDPAPNVFPGAAPGTAHISDRPSSPVAAASADDFAEQVKAMHSIEFQRLQDQMRKALSESTNAFKARDSEQALAILQGFLSELEGSPIAPNRIALLKRPVEERMRSFQSLHAQMEWENIQQGQRASALERRDRRRVAEKQKQEQVAELMNQYRVFFKEGKYKEAEMYAMKAHELDPDNAAADAAIHICRVQRNLTDANKAKESREVMFTRNMNAAENFGPPVDDKNPMLFDNDAFQRAKNRKGLEDGLISTRMNEKERAIEQSLHLPINLSFQDTPLRQVIDDLRAWTGMNIVADLPALEEQNISLEQPVTLKLEGVSRKSALNLLLRQVHLTYVIRDEVLQITTPKNAKGQLVQKTWPVADLIIPVDNHAIPNSGNLMKVLGQATGGIDGPPNLQLHNGFPTGFQNGVPVSSPMGEPTAPHFSPGMSPGLGGATTSATASYPIAGTRSPGQMQTMEDLLIKLITNTIAPNTWSDVGGPGTIDYFPIGMALVVNQTPDVQEQIQSLLNQLRVMQDVQISVEVRLISLSESFFERIGVDFDINLKTDKITRTYEPQLTTQQFKQFPYVNDFTPKRFISGLQPAGNFTSDLDIPIMTSSFDRAIPPFGAFPNSPFANGGIAMGLAFLSDIQVFLLLEAAQGDQRANVMQAPKLTLLNGQTSTIAIQDFQYFVLNVQLVQSATQMVFVPQNQPVPLGLYLAVQGVVSADRRFVRLNLNPTLTSLTSANVPLFPITTFVTPVFGTGNTVIAQGQPLVFTQFIQQPTFSLTSIQTSVNVPDGGTVLLGGLKILNEGRNEFGPPILSKLPYVNRLFRNVGYGRDTSSLLIMVTPRIIINLEEEEIQTGVRSEPITLD
ncbi:MAG: hypothetical protein ACK4RK_00420 [Gemmataceae bacterium]